MFEYAWDMYAVWDVWDMYGMHGIITQNTRKQSKAALEQRHDRAVFRSCLEKASV